ncbi:MAG: hypothetical protein HXY34_11660 [Candidatus Thorarchaeota archaeon]|nr:hypothetical protein [Candidatus Thorarchaeota archaeon]
MSFCVLQFVLIMPKTPTSGEFRLNDLPGTGGRIDVVCRSLAACFDWGPVCWPRERLQFHVVLSDKVTLSFRCPQQVPRGEVAWARTIKDSLLDRPPQYVELSYKSAEETLREISTAGSTIWVLDEEGTPIEDALRYNRASQNSFILGDHEGYDSSSTSLFQRLDLRRVSLGRERYLSSHCVGAVIATMEKMVARGQ